MGGDEFTIILGQINEEGDAALIAERIIDALAGPFQLCGQTSSIGVSIGISVFPYDGDDADALLKNADSAMYLVKEKGRNGYLIHGEAERHAA